MELTAAPADDLLVGMWFLIQLAVPQGAYCYVPTFARGVVTDYYEPTGEDYLRVEERCVRFKLDSMNRHKIGVRKTEATGRIGFLTNADGKGNAVLVVRNFLNAPSALYADVPLDNPSGETQDSVQSYNHHTGAKGFGEIEFHTPGVCRAMAEPWVTDVNQVWVFSGTRAVMEELAARLLGVARETFEA